jgi:predicted DCC family thiol-disulfide oxidoreductase YuxK
VTATLVYDGDCGICQASVDLLAWAGSTAVAVPSWRWVGEHPEHAELCTTTLLLVDPDGSVAVEESAVAGALRTTRAPLHWLAPMLTLPGVRLLSRTVYRAVSRNRARLSEAIGRDACSIGDHRDGGS